MPTPYGFDRQQIDAPKYVSRNEWTLTGTETVNAYWPLKLSSTSLDSGTWGLSGIYRARQLCEPYDDISGMSGCIGVSIRKMSKITNTGLRNQNIIRRQIAVLHKGPCYMEYKSGTLDGTPVTLRYGDLIAACSGGFRAFEELNYKDANYTGGYLHTGNRQTALGIYADVASNLTGTWKKVIVDPKNIYGAYP